MVQATQYSFEAKIASRRYHAYKNTTWVNGTEVQVEFWVEIIVLNRNECSIINLKNKIQKIILISDLRNFCKCHKIWKMISK